MAIDRAAFQAALEEVVTAIADDDWAGAAKGLAKAEVIHGGLIDSGSIGPAAVKRKASLDAAAKRIAEAREAATGAEPFEVISRLF